MGQQLIKCCLGTILALFEWVMRVGKMLLLRLGMVQDIQFNFGIAWDWVMELGWVECRDWFNHLWRQMRGCCICQGWNSVWVVIRSSLPSLLLGPLNCKWFISYLNYWRTILIKFTKLIPINLSVGRTNKTNLLISIAPQCINTSSYLAPIKVCPALRQITC